MIGFEQKQSDQITRQRQKLKSALASFGTISLKNEHRTGAILMAMVSVMATLVNGIDIAFVWFNFEYDGSQNLSQFVHEGTYLLILSILLSMAIMLYYFRGNQNFYIKNERLRWLANIWIIQNAIMVISVGIRNYHYIHHYGLAYKRIGVIFFLGLTLFGLITLFLKIKNKKSAFYLVRVNSWATYAMLLMLAAVNWDIQIAKHNTTHWNQGNIDLSFLLSLSDKTLPILDEHREIFRDQYVSNSAWDITTQKAEILLNNRIQDFVDKGTDYNWLSWTWPENQAFDYFKAQGITASNKTP